MEHGTGSDFTGKMKGNCIFNNSPAGLEGGRLAGLGSCRVIPAWVPGNPLAPEPAREAQGLHLLLAEGQWEPTESRPG